ncbi:hypothetical protein Droror1_Dr00016724 [Drosera rotundifolia]
MAMRSVTSRSSSLARSMEAGARKSSVLPRYFSGDGGRGGRVLSEEERAAENIYIQKMERERTEKAKLRAEKEKAEKEKEHADKKPDGEASKS